MSERGAYEKGGEMRVLEVEEVGGEMREAGLVIGNEEGVWEGEV